MLYQTTFTINAEPKDVFAAIHEYKLRQRPREFFSFLGLEKLVTMEFHVLTPHAIGPGATYDWTFRLLGVPVLAFQERIVDWIEGKTAAYRAISGWDMYFRVDVMAEAGGTRVVEQIDISVGTELIGRMLQGFIEWGLRRVGQRLIEGGLKAINQSVPLFSSSEPIR